ncbi:MAG: hypothetical protein V7642_1587 [Burkholderiales bacterium]
MRSVIHMVTSLFTLTQCLPCYADPANEQHHPREPAFVAGTALESGALDLYRAGAEVRNGIRPEGLVGSNAANNVITGMNSISEGAFTNASGLPIVIQNSGANVLIQNATIVNIQLQ